MDYLWLKWIHILSSTILFGTGIGSAFVLFMADRRRDIAAIHFAARHVVIADWLFTTPSVIVQFLSGIALTRVLGIPLSERWVIWAIGLYFFAGACWLPVVWMQIRMRDLAAKALAEETDLPSAYWRLARWWVFLGCMAFPTVIVIFYLMVFKP